MSLFIKKVLFPIAIFCSVFVLSLHLFNNPDAPDDNYILKAYKNTVALYNGEELIKTYNNIVLNTLPKKDIQNFNIGIPVATPAQAELFLEDFDG